jgi:hypothetical protein
VPSRRCFAVVAAIPATPSLIAYAISAAGRAASSADRPGSPPDALNEPGAQEFPGGGSAITTILVVSDVEASVSWYRYVLGAG